ncbi:MAG: hypothetical protein ACE5K7_01660 [Phycisphaerae bacterium]
MHDRWQRLRCGLVALAAGGGLLLQGCPQTLPEPNEVAAQIVSGLINTFLNQAIQDAISQLLGLGGGIY